MERRSKSKGSDSGSEPPPRCSLSLLPYNALYFDDTLGFCIVSWTDSRTVRENKRDHSYHGPSFVSKVNAINSSSVTDPQRPSDGYNIKISHDRRKEDDSYKAQTWTSISSGNTNDRSVNREPAANICISNVDHDKFCNKFSCHCHSQKMLCSGRYRKTTEALQYEEQTRVPKDAQKTGDKSEGSSYITRRAKRRLQNDEQTKEFSNDKMPNRNNNHMNKQSMKATILKTEGDAFPAKIPKGPSSVRFRKKHRNDLAEKKVLVGEKTLGSHWFAYYADEEIDEHIEPLVNKRTERRKREKAIYID